MKVLTYHNVGIAPRGAKLKTLYIKPSMLRRQILWLKLLGYRFVKSEEFLNTVAVSRSLLLTFDDAYMDFWKNALPVLKANRVPALVFVPVGLIGKFNLWDYERVNVKKPIMDWSHIKELLTMGMEIGSHTVSHPYLSKLSLGEAKEEIESSKKILEDKLGVEIKSFCYPYGDYNERVRDMVMEAGYKMAFTTKPGKHEESPNPFEIRRTTLFGNDFLPKFLLKVLL
ncbi:MAG: polysaccharide deacetylase family protein [Aquificaceae bacterium]